MINKNLKRTYIIYFSAIFLAAFLFAHIQPLISKYILPWYGGAAWVWIVSVLFFQAILLISYLYAHLLSKYFSKKIQVIIHLILLASSLTSLQALPNKDWFLDINLMPSIEILLIYSGTVGLQLILLAATSPLLQKWFSESVSKKSVYKLYAVSNIGSLLAFLSFPFILEPLLSINLQANIWIITYVLFLLLTCFVAAKFWQSKSLPQIKKVKTKIKRKKIFLWLGLPLITSILLLAMTAKITEDISAVPMLWLAPLSLFFFSYIVAFNSKKQKQQLNTAYLALGFLLLALIYLSSLTASIVWTILCYLVFLFLIFLILHTRLYQSRPKPEHLTTFYFIISLGSVLGSFFVAVIAPLIFDSYIEYPLMMIISITTAVYIFYKNEDSDIYHIFDKFKQKKYFLIIVILMTAHIVLIQQNSIFNQFSDDLQKQTIQTSRNFYGVLEITTEIDNNQEIKILTSGTTLHGIQYTNSDLKKTPTSYYSQNTGVGLAITKISQDQNIKLAGIGLGVGTIAAYGKTNDQYTFYEINTEVINYSQKHFSFIKDSPAEIEIISNDARIAMEKQGPQNFDIIVLDAFNSDSIPVHLLTKQAFETYFKHLKQDGIVAIHITNRYLNLEPIILKHAQYFDLDYVYLINYGDTDSQNLKSDWFLLSKNKQILSSLKQSEFSQKLNYNLDKYKQWTDDYSNLLQIIN